MRITDIEAARNRTDQMDICLDSHPSINFKLARFINVDL